MTTPAPPAAAAAGGGGSLVSKVGGPRNAAILGAGLTVAAVAVLSSFRSKGATGTTTTMTDSAFDSGPYDMWNAWQEEYEDLQEQINAAGGGTTTATGPGTPAPSKPPVPVPIPKPPVPRPAPKPPWGKPVPKPPTTTKPAAHKTVTIKRGDTLSAIAKKNHISMATLKKLNPVFWTNKKYKNGNLIWAGGKVKVS